MTVDNNAQMEAVMERKISTITQVLYSSTIFFYIHVNMGIIYLT